MKYKQFFRIYDIAGTPYYSDGRIIFHKAWKGFPPKRGIDASDFGKIKDENILNAIITIADNISIAQPVIFLGRVKLAGQGVAVFSPNILAERDNWIFMYDIFSPPFNSIGKKYKPHHAKVSLCDKNYNILYFKDKKQDDIPFAFCVLCLEISDFDKAEAERRLYYV